MFIEEIKNQSNYIVKVFKNESFQRWLIALVTLGLSFFLIAGEFNFAKDDSKNSIFHWNGFAKTMTKGQAHATLESVNRIDYFFNSLEKARNAIERNYLEKDNIIGEFITDIRKQNITIRQDQVALLLLKVNIDDFAAFKNAVKEELNKLVTKELNGEDMKIYISSNKNNFLGKYWSKEMRETGDELLKSVIMPSLENNIQNNVVFGQGIYLAGLAIILIMLMLIIVYYLKTFRKEMLVHRSDLLLISMAAVITLLIAKIVYGYSPLAIPVFVGTMLIAILLDLNLALVINLIMTIAVVLIAGNDIGFIFMSLVSGNFAAFLVAKNGHRSKLSLVGLIVGVVNALIIGILGITGGGNKDIILRDCLIAFLNGILSIILTVGILPFIESVFNVITPIKLLELMNPNQPLLKRLLFEAPGTYHHSLMVGNLAEAAAEEIGANSMIARVGAYYHDIGKLKRPNFYMENQMNDNPHDRLTPSLSSLVITAHPSDGSELAVENKIPLAIIKIIKEHHGNTLVAYFYHKARKGEKGELVTEESFRYQGPKPSSKESAVVMLADSVEAAIRSMSEKTEGKIEGMIRKIIKEKLDDGQLDGCNLTLKDLDVIAKAFTHVFDGYYHERESYPDSKASIVIQVASDSKNEANKNEEGNFFENTG